MKTLILATLLLCINSFAATWQKITSGVPTYQVCPDGYVFVPALSGYTSRDFCVAKYEMKNDGYGTAVSQMSGTPWVGSRVSARAACQAIGYGYDLISNDQWQTIARNIAGTASNWSGGAVANGELNRGHTDALPAVTLAAAADTDPCNGTGQTCSASTWDSQRRTHTLSNGNVIWDLSGNVVEWVTNDSNVSNGARGNISTMSAGDIRQTRYGAAAGTFCATPSASPYCGMGEGIFNYAGGAVSRGGRFDGGIYAGVFATNLYYASTFSDSYTGFRCVFTP